MTLADTPEPGIPPAPPGELAPVAPGERIAELDILRGLALLGICIINIPGFYAPYHLWAAGEELYPARVDRVAEWLVEFLGSGKFNSMFSFLFGVGFAIQMGRAASTGAAFVPLYLRRLLVLFLFGVAHILFFWDGDVLHMYALLGLPLLFVRKLRNGWLWAIAIACVVAPIARSGYRLYEQKPPKHPPAYYRERAEEQFRVYGRGSYDDVLSRYTKSAPPEPRPVVGRGEYWPAARERVRMICEIYAGKEGLWFFAVLGATMTVGFLVGRARVFDDVPAHLPLIRRAAVWTGVVGLALAAAYATVTSLMDPGVRAPTLLGFAGGSLYLLNRPVLCAFYVCVIVLLAQRPSWRRAMTPLAIAGRMPLTNYLGQSAIHSLLFYGYGLNLYARVTPAVGILIAVGTFAFEVLFSLAWFSRFRFGPLEWLWRTLTYGRPPAHAAPVARPIDHGPSLA
jgi:uncharacterized protein